MNEFQRPSQPAPSSAPNGELVDWYYRLGDRERGPMTLSQLTDLVAGSGEMAREIVVKHHANGAWVPYESVDPETAKRLHTGGVSVAAPAAATPTAVRNDSGPASITRGVSASVKLRRPLGEILPLNRFVLGGVAVWLCFNLVLWFALDPLRRTERGYFQTISDAAQKARDARKLDDAERGRVAASVAKEVKPIVEALKKTANASDPIQQHLLWAAKDQLPRLFSADGKDLGQCDAIFQRHMYEAGRRLGIDVSLPPTSVVIE
jgi:hypothetical protein